MQYKCDICQDTGSRDKSGDYLDCGHCDAAMQRKSMNDFLDKLPAMGDYDAAWLVHQRALSMATKQEAPKQEPVAWLVYAEDHNGMAPQHPAYATHLHATRCASMFGQTPTEIRPLYDHAAPAAANGALTDEQILIIRDTSSHSEMERVRRMLSPGEANIAFARAILAAAGPDTTLVSLIHKAQIILGHHLPPDGPDAKTTISALLGLLDGPESRAALSGAKGN